MDVNTAGKLSNNLRDDFRKILIAEYDDSVIACLSYALQKKEIELTTCNEFDQAVGALVTARYDLLITGIEMPGANVFLGLQLLGFVKKHFCPEVIVIAHNWKENEREWCRFYGLHCLNKPLDVKEVLTICNGIDIHVEESY
jgi:DNA-binding response OmpR family regulator